MQSKITIYFVIYGGKMQAYGRWGSRRKVCCTTCKLSYYIFLRYPGLELFENFSQNFLVSNLMEVFKAVFELF